MLERSQQKYHGFTFSAEAERARALQTARDMTNNRSQSVIGKLLIELIVKLVVFKFPVLLMESNRLGDISLRVIFGRTFIDVIDCSKTRILVCR